MYNMFYNPYRSYVPVTPEQMGYAGYYDPQWAYQYAYQLLSEEAKHETPKEFGFRQRDDVDEIFEIIATRHRDVLNLIEAYGIPRAVSRAATRNTIRFVLENESRVSGNLQQKTEALYRRFIAQDRLVLSVLRAMRIPENVISQFVRQVIRITLRNIDTQPGQNVNVRRILRAFEDQYPNFLGLTTRYDIPINVARSITRDIIEFTLNNLNRIPRRGSIDQRANAMLRLLDSTNPELIERMIRRGVPAGQAEAITKQIIRFTLNQVPLPREETTEEQE